MRPHALFKAGDARIIDHDIGPRVQGREPFPVGFLLHVQRQCFATQFFPGGLQHVGIAVGKQNRRAFVDKGPGNRLAYAAGSTGDNAKFS